MRNAMKENIVLFPKVCMYDFSRILLGFRIDGFYFWKMDYILLFLNYVTGSNFWGIFWISICIKNFTTQNLASVRHLIDILPLQLELYFSDKVKDFTNQNLITETQLINILPLSINLHFSPWLTTDQIRMKCAECL